MDLSIRERGLKIQPGVLSQVTSCRFVFKTNFVFKLIWRFLRLPSSKRGNEICFCPFEKSQNSIPIDINSKRAAVSK